MGSFQMAMLFRHLQMRSAAFKTKIECGCPSKSASDVLQVEKK